MPVITQDNRIIALTPITTTVFDDTDTTVDIDGTLYPIVKKEGKANMGSHLDRNLDYKYFALIVTPTQERQNNYGPGRLMPYIPRNVWQTSPGFARRDETSNSLLQMLQGQLVAPIVPLPDPGPSPSDGILRINLGVRFHTTAEEHQFLDVNWVELLQAQFTGNDLNLIPNTLTIGAQTASPGAPGDILVFVLRGTPVYVGVYPQFNTIRFVKAVPTPVIAGDYVWDAIVTNSNGLPVTVSLTLTVVV
jgi:hypothetical protein